MADVRRRCPGRRLAAAAIVALALSGLQAAALVTGNPDAPQGGWMVQDLSADPINLNPITSNDYYTTIINIFIYESLLEQDLDTYEWQPLLADRWEVAPDQLSFTFHVNPAARFSDGTPVTGEDVKYSFDILFDDKVNNVFQRAYYQNIERCELLDPMTVRFAARNLYFQNLNMVALLPIVPRHLFTEHDVNTSPLNLQPVGSGPYRLIEWIKGNRIILERDRNYWGNSLPTNSGRYNVERIAYKVVRDPKVSFEMFKKGDIDFYSFGARQWVKESQGEPFGTRLHKLDVQNKVPHDYSYIGWNNSSELFSDPLVRQAMTHLVDRELLAQKFYFGFSEVSRGPFGNYSEYSSPAVQALPFDVARAIELLRQAGWDDHDRDTVLDKDGRRFEFSLISPGQDMAAILTLIQEDMRRAGVIMHIKVVEWNSFQKLLDNQKFEAVTLLWTGVVDPDPFAIWHSASSAKGGNNFISYKNPEVDRLCDQAIVTMDRNARIPIIRRIHELIAADQPYTFLLEPTHSLVGYSAKYRFVQPFYNYGIGYAYWWIPPELQSPGEQAAP